MRLLRYWPIIFWLLLFAIFLFPVIFMKQGFLYGDYAVQFYPWHSWYASSLKQGYLPFWNSLVLSGFPQFAEGQTGMFYPINLFLFKVLPFPNSYNWMFVIHFVLGGVFSYCYARYHRYSIPSAVITSSLFTFGSSYAGCFYTIVSLRTLVWTPLVFLCADIILQSKNGLKFGASLGLVLALLHSCLAGYPQAAFYLYGFLVLYVFIQRLEAISKKKYGRFELKNDLRLLFCLIIPVVLAYPQLWITFETALNSTRSGHDKTFVLWGSVAPWSFIAAFFYLWDSVLRFKWYIGVVPLWLILFQYRFRALRYWWWMVFAGIFLSLGAFNPLYWILIHLPLSSLLRNPSKFLFFSVFFLSMIVGKYFDQWMDRMKAMGANELSHLIRRGFLILVIIYASALGLCLIVHFGEPVIVFFGNWYVDAFVINKSFHQWSPEYYSNKVLSIMKLAQKQINPTHILFWLPGIISSLFLLSSYCFNRNQKYSKLFLFFLMTLVSADLLIYGLTGHGHVITKNLRAFPDLSFQRTLPRDGRWMDVMPSHLSVFKGMQNLLTSHKNVGGYTPILNRDYYELMKPYGVVDDGFGRPQLNSDILKASHPFLNFLSVKYLVAPSNIGMPGWRMLKEGSDWNIWINDEVMSEINFVTQSSVFKDRNDAIDFIHSDIFNPSEHVVFVSGEPYPSQKMETSSPRLIIRDRREARLNIQITLTQPGWVVWNESYDSRWMARVNGEKVRVHKANLSFQAIYIKEGQNNIEWTYEPFSSML